MNGRRLPRCISLAASIGLGAAAAACSFAAGPITLEKVANGEAGAADANSVVGPLVGLEGRTDDVDAGFNLRTHDEVIQSGRPVIHSLGPYHAGMFALAPILAHQGGWDEILMVAAPVALFAGLLWMANRRADAEVGQREAVEEDPSTEPHP